MKSLQAVITGIALSAVAIVAHAAEQTVSVPDNAGLKWQDVPNTRGAVSYANVEGDIFGKGPYSAYVKFRKGTDNGLHTHSQTLPTVVLDSAQKSVPLAQRSLFWVDPSGQLTAPEQQAVPCSSQCFPSSLWTR